MSNVTDANAVELRHDDPVNSTGSLMLSSDNLDRMYRAAEMMASARITVPKHLAGSPGDCLAIIMQATQWGMNPFAVAQKTHLVNGTLGYEAQLVNAAVSSSPLLGSRIGYDWEGDWKGVNGKADKSDERAVTVSATLKGESEPRKLRVSMAQVGVRNSPNWESDPRQQIAYLATKKWARLHAPDVLLGVYTTDEVETFQQPTERHMGDAEEVKPETPALPATRANQARDALAKRKTAALPPPALGDVLSAIASADTLDALKATTALAARLDGRDKDSARAAYTERRQALETPPAGAYDLAAAIAQLQAITDPVTLATTFDSLAQQAPDAAVREALTRAYSEHESTLDQEGAE